MYMYIVMCKPEDIAALARGRNERREGQTPELGIPILGGKDVKREGRSRPVESVHVRLELVRYDMIRYVCVRLLLLRLTLRTDPG